MCSPKDGDRGKVIRAEGMRMSGWGSGRTGRVEGAMVVVDGKAVSIVRTRQIHVLRKAPISVHNC